MNWMWRGIWWLMASPVLLVFAVVDFVLDRLHIMTPEDETCGR